MTSGLAQVANNVGKGLLAGMVGTVAMTTSSTIEMRLRGRGGSSTPLDAASKVLGIESFESDDAESRFGRLVHWGYGTGWGAVRGVLDAVGLPPVAADVGHFSAVYGGEQVMLPALDVMPPATQWGTKEIIIDAWHHLVYAAAVGAAYRWLSSQE